MQTDDRTYYEDIEVDVVNRYGRYEVTRDEVIEFASRYDPQPFHLDDAAAAQTHFGRLSASGWHTASMVMRMMVDNFKAIKQAGLGSPGVDKMEWKRPVYPGDVLRCEAITKSKRRSKSRPEMGLLDGRVEAYNQHDELVLVMESIGLIEVRDPSAPIES
ncbi:MAG: MaoC family dehydratase [Pseudomonadota bacterium]